MPSTDTIRKPRTLLLTLILGGGVVGYSFGLFLPGQETVASLRAELRTRHMAIIQADRLLYPIQQAEQEVRQAREFLAEVGSQTPVRNELAGLVGRIHQEAVASKVEIVRFEPLKVKSFQTLHQRPMELIVEGRFSTLADFLHRLENLSAPFQLPQLQIARTGANDETLRLEMTLTIFTDIDENSG